jgi:hypothetical protein
VAAIRRSRVTSSDDMLPIPSMVTSSSSIHVDQGGTVPPLDICSELLRLNSRSQNHHTSRKQELAVPLPSDRTKTLSQWHPLDPMLRDRTDHFFHADDTIIRPSRRGSRSPARYAQSEASSRRTERNEPAGQNNNSNNLDRPIVGHARSGLFRSSGMVAQKPRSVIQRSGTSVICHLEDTIHW